MKDMIRTPQEAQLYTCKSCGKNYIVRKCEVRHSSTDKYRHYCVPCQKAYLDEQRKKREEQENLEWQKKKAEEQKIFESLLSEWNLKELSEIRPSSKESLFIIGNGFDLMHGVKSSYYAFRDSLGKHSSLRTWLENFWTPEDIWADLENGLAHFDMNAMGSRFMVDDWLDNYDAYDEDASYASFFMAAETAAAPMIEVSTELPMRFRRWVETLTIGTDDRPLEKLIVDGKVLNFNYTEFAEKLYDISPSDICYIHGCRKRKKEKLILGHRPGASECSYELDDKRKNRKNSYRNSLVEAAQEQVFQIVSECDDELTKDCESIIKSHEVFFDSVKNVQDIIVIGHSMSQVDWDYFGKVASELNDLQAVTWYFGCHGLNDLKNMEALVRFLKIEKKNIVVFRTDIIRVNFYAATDKASTDKKNSSGRILAESADKKWRAEFCKRNFKIIDLTKGCVSCEVLLSPDVRTAFFDETESHLFVIIRGIYSGVLLFSLRNDVWVFVNEFEGIPNQGLLNRRLRKVFLSKTHITFVYNSRVRRYHLEDGLMTENRAVQNISTKDNEKYGRDISHYFVRG